MEALSMFLLSSAVSSFVSHCKTTQENLLGFNEEYKMLLEMFEIWWARNAYLKTALSNPCSEIKWSQLVCGLSFPWGAGRRKVLYLRHASREREKGGRVKREISPTE